VSQTKVYCQVGWGPGGKDKPEKDKQTAVREEGTITTGQAQTTQPAPLTADVDVYVEALGSIRLDDWCRTWTADRTIMLRRTSKRVKEVADKISCLPLSG
jgi:hypothetical protein